MRQGVRRTAALCAATAVCLALAACSQSVTGSPAAVPSGTVSKTQMAAGFVKESMQHKLNTDLDLSKYDLKVIDVALVNKSGNEYKGIAIVRTTDGVDHDVPVEVTADAENTLWEAPPGAFLFAVEDDPTNPPPAALPAPAPPAPAPRGPAALPVASDGRVYVVTKSGKTRCRISTFEVDCQSPFVGAPLVYGQPANGITFTADGSLTYKVGDLGDIPATTMGYTTYRALSWTVDATVDGTTFTHNGTGRGVFVSITSVQAN